MLDEFNQVIDYIERHLQEEISQKDIAKITGTSDYHFRRMFSFLTGMSLHEYIRNRRLSVANQDLLLGEKVTDVAFKYRYQSTDGFSNAFLDWSGFRPSEVIKSKRQKFFPKLEFSLKIQGGISMEFRIEKKEPFNIIGVSKRVPMQFEGENDEIIKLAQSITEEQKNEMHKLGNLYPNQVVNASYSFNDQRTDEKGSLEHLIGFLSTEKSDRYDLTQISIDSNLWAIFPIKGTFPSTLQETWARIFSEWLPASKYELVEAPEISFTKFEDNSVEKYSEIWIAVKEK
ncbi:AraC family transcriptional regulator [Vagococcus elongatus]|uniref:GyrI-like domain-containing protein n=1 Tax=Vagococcus elongatus TaxID=180344 RepID=A0A430B454_9ENTE|nr:AraC family transcriptional regulator [Vagococcus elongatus]RSU15093.1 GyrI-like domain-containing protein [Vagococcus elongatus]